MGLAALLSFLVNFKMSRISTWILFLLEVGSACNSFCLLTPFSIACLKPHQPIHLAFITFLCIDNNNMGKFSFKDCSYSMNISILPGIFFCINVGMYIRVITWRPLFTPGVIGGLIRVSKFSVFLLCVRRVQKQISIIYSSRKVYLSEVLLVH